MTLETRNQKPETRLSGLRHPTSDIRGYTLVELVVAVGLFALVMTLASGAYFLMISINQQVQGTVTGINNLSFALETMIRTIRTGTEYTCPVGSTGACATNNFSLKDANAKPVRYARSLSNGNGAITQNDVALTDPSVNISSLMFYVSGTKPFSIGSDRQQPHITIIVSGTVSSGPGKPLQTFTVETGATMRGTDL